MKIRLLAGAAAAALTVLCVPATAATMPELPAAGYSASAQQAVASFYAARGGAPLWLRGGAESNAARELIGVLERAPLDGLEIGDSIHISAVKLPNGVTPANTEEDFTVATIVAPSAMKAEEEETAPADAVPTVEGGEEGETEDESEGE